MTISTFPDLKGIGASAGNAAGPVFIASEAETTSGAVIDFSSAVEAVASRLGKLADGAAERNKVGAAILQSQALMARDPALAAAVAEEEAAGRSLREAIRAAAERYARRLEGVDDPYLQERAADLREVGRLLSLQVAGVAASRLAGLDCPSIVFAHELSPADTLGVDSTLLLGLVIETGGLTSHAAIVARELGVPAVVGTAGAVERARHFPAAEIDGQSGEVRLLERVERRSSISSTQVLDLASSPIPLMANVGSADSALVAAKRGAAGIGLFRTEFMFMAAQGPMSEDDQFEVYRSACVAMAPHPVIVRTLDAGADKPLPYLPASPEANPQLGRRGVRMWLAVPGLWRPQVRALLRTAAMCPNLKVMIPMVAARGEMVVSRRLFSVEARSLRAPVPPIGMMVEVPGVAAALESFAGVTDFISFGTNDLTQYTVAADRGMQWSEDLSELNPGVLRLIALAVAAAGQMGIPAGVCGELASQPAGAVVLAGIGVDSLSMTVTAIPDVLEALSRMGLEKCRAAAGTALVARRAKRSGLALRRALA